MDRIEFEAPEVEIISFETCDIINNSCTDDCPNDEMGMPDPE